MSRTTFRFGEWLVNPLANSIERAGERRQMEPRAMDVLVVLCKAHGAIVSADELLAQCWRSGVYGDNPVHKTLTQLRRLLGDTASAPTYIETIRKRGYRTLAALSFEHGAEPAAWRDVSPFRGLQAFDEDHAAVFFGRDEMTRQLVTSVDAQVRSGLALALVLGSSGSGKTSLVRAGLFPALSLTRATSGLGLVSATTFDLGDAGAATEASLLIGLASAMLDLHSDEAGIFPGASASSLGHQFEHDLHAVLRALKAALDSARARCAAGRPLRFGVFIDRFEALFHDARVSPAARQLFLDVLGQLARSASVVLVIACRNDFYPRIAQYPILMEGKPNGAHFDLAPPGFADIAQIIRLPAAAAGLRFGTDPKTQARLDDVLCASAARSPDGLPLLQYCLEELYRLRTDAGELSFEALHQVGGVEGAIARRAEQVLAQLNDAQHAALAHVMSLVVLLSTNEETVTSRRAPWSALRSDAEREVVAALVESRLMVSDLSGEIPSFGIAHEAILRRWPRVRDWIEAHRGALLVRARLTQLAARWLAEGRSAELLLPRGKQLDAAKGLQEAGVFTLNEDETQLIRLSVRRARLGERARLLAMGTIVMLAVLAGALGISATGARSLAEQRRLEAEGLMSYMLGDFADKLRPLGRLDLLDSVSGKALDYLSRQVEQGEGTAALTQRAKALQLIGELRRARGDSQGAMAALVSANAILTGQHLARPSDTDVLKNLGVNAYWLGQLSKDSNDWGQAVAFWRQYQVFSDRLHLLEPDKVEWWVEQSYAHNNLGSLAATRGDPAGAAREFLRSIALKKRAMARQPKLIKVDAELADSYSWLASATESLGDLEQAGQLFAQEMEIIQRLRLTSPTDSLWVRREVRALQHRALNRMARGMPAQALEDYREARQLFTRIVGQDSKNRRWQSEVVFLELEEQQVAYASASVPDMAARLANIHARMAALLAFDPNNVNWARREAITRLRIAQVSMANRQFDVAQQQNNAALERLQPLFAKNPANKSVRLATANALILAAQISNAVGDRAAAALACQRAHGLLKENGSTTQDFQVLDPWVRINHCLGNWEAAAQAEERLRKIGYRDVDYLRYLSNQPRKKSS